MLLKTKSAFYLTKIAKGDKWCRSFMGKFSENPEIGEFPKSEPLNREFWKESELNGTETPGRKCRASKHFPTRRVILNCMK